MKIIKSIVVTISLLSFLAVPTFAQSEADIDTHGARKAGLGTQKVQFGPESVDDPAKTMLINIETLLLTLRASGVSV